MKAKFYLRDNPDKLGKVPIFLYIHHKGEQFIYYTGIKIDPGKKTIEKNPESKFKNKVTWSNWNDKNDPSQVRGKGELITIINSKLKRIQAEAETAFAKGQGDVDFTKDYFIQNMPYMNKLYGDVEAKLKEPDFFNVWEQYIQSGKTQKSWTQGTVNRMNTLRAELEKLDKKNKIKFSTINESFLEMFLQQHYDQGWLNSYTAKNYKVLKGFLHWSTRRGFNTNLAYQGFEVKLKTPRIDDNIYTLEDQELDKIMNMKVKSPEQEVTRDCFVFQCYSGMRFGDMLNLKNSDINSKSIHIKTEKTGQPVDIPLNNITKRIIQKYKGSPDGMALPVISNQKYNKAIQRMGKDAKLNRIVEYVNFCGSEKVTDEFKLYQKMTSHTGRKSFIKIGLIYLGIKVEEMIKITGHSLDQIRAYYDLTNEEKEKIAQKFDLLSKHNYLAEAI